MLTALATALALAIPAIAASDSDSTREYIVLTNGKGVAAKQLADIRAAGGTIERVIPQVGLVTVSGSDDFAVAANSIRGVRSVSLNATVDWLPGNETVVAANIGNPPNSGSADFFFDLQWGHDAVNAPEAWANGKRGEGALVAVLDTGFDLTHPDLVPNINEALSMDFTGEGLQYNLPDPFSHGTHVAGTIAAAQNDFGTIGVAPDATLMLVKVLGDEGSGTFDDVIAGIIHAADNGADIINMSLGARLERNGFFDDNDEFVTAREVAELLTALDRATTYAYQSGTTVIASAGNDAENYDGNGPVVHSPSDSPHVISISATAPIGWATDPGNIFLDNLASYSNFGRSVIDFAAPGGDFILPGEDPCTIAGLERPCWVFDLVFSTGSLNSWYWSAGTSMAAPHASGVAALIVGANGGDMKPAHVERELRKTADDLGQPGNDPFYGMGRVNANG
jgi:lantibiotic leader peptide-processing serine protease